MANNEQRRQKSIQKRKDKRAAKPRAAREPGRQLTQPDRSVPLSVAARWPLSLAHATLDWDSDPDGLHAAFSRENAEGEVVAAFFSFSLNTGLSAIELRQNLSEPAYLSRVADDAEPRAMVEVEPGLVVALIQAALRADPMPAGISDQALADALALFGEVTEHDSPYRVTLDGEAEADPDALPARSWFGSIKAMFGLAR